MDSGPGRTVVSSGDRSAGGPYAAMPASGRTRTLPSKLPQCVFAAGIVAWVAMALVQVRRLWFFGDDFDFLLNRSVRLGGPDGLLAPHNEHWSTIPILVYRLNVAAFGLHHYLPYAVLPLLLHVLIVVLGFVVLRRSGGSAGGAALCALVVLFLGGGAGWENVLWDFQIGFLGSCLSGLVALVLLQRDHPSVRNHVLAVVVLTAGLMCSGIGLLATFWVGVYVALCRGLRAGAMTILVPATAFVVWFTTTGHGHHGAPPPERDIAWRATLNGLDNVWSAVTMIPYTGTAILLGLVVAVASKRGSPLFPLAASGLATLVVAYALFGYTRSGMGVDATTVSRYTYLGIVFCAPALSMALERGTAWLARRRPPTPAALWAGCALLVLVVGAGQLMANAEARQEVGAPDKERLAAIGSLVEHRGRLLRSDVVPLFAAGFSIEALAQPAVRSTIPAVRARPAVVLDVEGLLQVDVRASTFGLPSASHVEWGGGASRPAVTTVSDLRCETAVASARRSLTIPVGADGAELRITTDGSSLATALVSGHRATKPVEWRVAPHRAAYVASTAQGARLRVYLPPGRATVCTR